MTKWIFKNDPNTYCLQETHFIFKDTHHLRVKGWKKIPHESGNHKEAGLAILILDKIDFMSKTITK